MDATIQRSKAAAPTRRSFVKSSSLGGEQESGFEQAFSSLAYAYLKDKAPRLLDFLVGFQLVERNEDNTKAMGVFGFKLGKQWLYAPVFFLNGDLKGHELLYVKNKDMFVPMKENWVNHMMSKKPAQLGERSPQDTYQMGGMAPNIERLSWPPEQSKYGSDSFDLNRGMGKEGSDLVMPVVAACAMKKAKFLFRKAASDKGFDIKKVAADPFAAALFDKLDLPGLLRASVHIAKAAHDLYDKVPGIKIGFDKFYGKGFFQKLARDIRDDELKDQKNIMPTRVKKAAAKPGKSLIPVQEKKAAGSAVKLITRDDVATVEHMPELTEAERRRLLNDGVLIVDRREGEEVSVSYNTQAAPQRLCNPHETGLYDILEKPGDFEEHLVISNPYSNRGQENGVTTVRLGEGTKAWKNIARQALWSRHVGTAEDYKKWFDALPDGSTDLSKGGTYIAVNWRGQGTVPFEVRHNYEDDTYKVDFESHFDRGPRRPGDLSHTFDKGFNNHDGDYVSSYGAMVFFNKRQDSKLRAINGELHIPDTFKIFKIKSPPKPKKSDNNIMDGMPSVDSESYEPAASDPPPIKPGDIGDIQLMITQKTARMKIYADHNEVTISTTKTGSDRMSAQQGIFALVRQHGLTEKAAREMVKTAQLKGQRVYRIKYAGPFPFAETSGAGPSSPMFPAPEMGSEQHGYSSSPAMYPQEEYMPVEGLQSDRTDPRIYDPFMQPDQNAVSMAQQAGQEGRKDVFDVGMISGLLKAVRQDSLVDRYLSDLLKALDRLGRMLFLFYWHQEEFEDRYGKQDLPELEDSIRNAFETLGDVTLFLQEKTIDVGMDDIGDPDIEEAARN